LPNFSKGLTLVLNEANAVFLKAECQEQDNAAQVGPYPE
jgi:hypothetical protein